MTEWISVKDAFPNEEFILIYCPNDKGLKIRIGKCVPDLHVFNDLEITHWMPLPKLPREKEDE